MMRLFKSLVFCAATFVFVSANAAFDCTSLIESELDTRRQAAELFPSPLETLTVVICKQGDEPVYQWLYTFLHNQDKHKYAPSSGALSNVSLPFNPNPKSKTTGVVLGEASEPNRFTIKLRTRFAAGQALDISQSVEVKLGDSQVIENNGFILGVQRLP